MELFQEAEDGFSNFRFGLDFEEGGAGGPGFVSSPLVLLRSGEVSEEAVGEFDGESGGKRAGFLNVEAGFGEGFTGHGGNGEVADAEDLEHDGQSGR